MNPYDATITIIGKITEVTETHVKLEGQWLPKSEIRIIELYGEARVDMPAWLAADKGWA